MLMHRPTHLQWLGSQAGPKHVRIVAADTCDAVSIYHEMSHEILNSFKILQGQSAGNAPKHV
jgi:hypothetical protein